jgi:hypothetical protein
MNVVVAHWLHLRCKLVMDIGYTKSLKIRMCVVKQNAVKKQAGWSMNSRQGFDSNKDETHISTTI